MELLVCPKFDPPFDWIYSGLKERGILNRVEFVLSDEEHMTHDDFLYYASLADTILIAMHGYEDGLVIKTGEPYAISITDDAKYFTGKTFVMLVCSLGRDYGKALQKYGNNFVGYVNDVYMIVHDKVRDLFFNPFFKPFEDALNGLPLDVIYYDTVAEYETSIRKAYELYSDTEDPLYRHVISMLVHNMKSFVVYFSDGKVLPASKKGESMFTTLSKILGSYMAVVSLTRMLR